MPYVSHLFILIYTCNSQQLAKVLKGRGGGGGWGTHRLYIPTDLLFGIGFERLHLIVNNMSTIHDYEANAQRYEKIRLPAGVNHILGALHVKLGKSLREIRVLDAGCGTGNYAKELLDAGVGHVAMLDISDAMLDIARIKLKMYLDDGRAHIIKNRLPTIPYPDGSFDCVLFMAVLHHLDKHDLGNPVYAADGAQCPKMQLACQEARRVLQPEGIMAIQNMSLDQL